MNGFVKIISIVLLLALFAGCGGVVQEPEVTAEPIVETAKPTTAPTQAPIVIETSATAEVTGIPTFTPEPTATPVPTGLLHGRFAEKFLPEGETRLDETSYRSDALCIEISIQYIYSSADFDPSQDTHDKSLDRHRNTCYVVDVYLQDIKLLKTGSAGDSFAALTTDEVTDIAGKYNALLAVSGDYYAHETKGTVYRNGQLFRDSFYQYRDSCFLYLDGTVEMASRFDHEGGTLTRDNVWQAWTFGPILVDGGEVLPATQYKGYSIATENPRCAFGYFEPGHYCFVIVDGRQRYYSYGMTLEELAEFMKGLGCVSAFNLDGGESAQLYWNGGIYSKPSDGGRQISDVIYFTTYGG